MLLLVFFCLARQWSARQGLVCGRVVAAPAVTVQPDPGVTGSVAVVAGVARTLRKVNS